MNLSHGSIGSIHQTCLPILVSWKKTPYLPTLLQVKKNILKIISLKPSVLLKCISYYLEAGGKMGKAKKMG
ncbi:MAG: hypothetical protein JNL69_13530 [Bacteroidia bacterium]|nr:hypothetical protein [Bacteroidia bacterium]